MSNGKTLIIQIPCFNEAANLGITLASLPRVVPGFARTEWMIIDDGSTDQTVAVAKAAGVDHIVRLGRNQGLARAFAAGIEAALRAGADVIVNTDADNQYRADDIPKLIAPILGGEADLAQRSGARQIHEIGCGEGFLSTSLAQSGFSVRGSDLCPSAVAMARRRAGDLGLPVTFRVADLYDLTPEGDGAELVVCCEVLEHLTDPTRALGVLAGLARPNLIVSVPREPLWRILNIARCRYWRALGNTPGHLQHWSAPSFLALLEGHVEVREVRTPLPWTMALCRRR